MCFRITGDPVVRPQSEFKVSTPVDKPPTAPFSAPPNVIEQAKMEGIVFALHPFHSYSFFRSLSPPPHNT